MKELNVCKMYSKRANVDGGSVEEYIIMSGIRDDLDKLEETVIYTFDDPFVSREDRKYLRESFQSEKERLSKYIFMEIKENTNAIECKTIMDFKKAREDKKTIYGDDTSVSVYLISDMSERYLRDGYHLEEV